AYCGVVGLKPTSGLIGRGGLALLAPSLDTIGVLTRRANLLWPAVTTLAGSDTDDPRSASVPLEWDQRDTVSDLSTLRFGIPKQLELVNCEPAIYAGFSTARRAISELGATIVDVDMPVWDPAAARHAGLLVIEAEGAVELGELLNIESALSTSLQQMLRYGAALSADRLDAAYATIRDVGGAVARAWQDVDALLMPTTPQRAFAHGISPPNNQAELTALANFSGCPAVTLPVWDPQSDLPASVQLIAPKWSESRLTSWAEILESAVRVTHLPTPAR
ncbi:MAG: amidase family protein, partial [Paracoccaceae bacterium]